MKREGDDGSEGDGGRRRKRSKRERRRRGGVELRERRHKERNLARRQGSDTRATLRW